MILQKFTQNTTNQLVDCNEKHWLRIAYLKKSSLDKMAPGMLAFMKVVASFNVLQSDCCKEIKVNGCILDLFENKLTGRRVFGITSRPFQLAKGFEQINKRPRSNHVHVKAHNYCNDYRGQSHSLDLICGWFDWIRTSQNEHKSLMYLVRWV